MGPLSEATLQDLHNVKHVVIFKDSAPVGQVLRVLAEKRLVSSPVVRAGKDDGSQWIWPQSQVPEEYIGFVDIRNIIKRFLADIHADEIMGISSMLKKMRKLEVEGEAFSTKTIAELGLANKGDGSFIDSESCKLTLLEILTNDWLDVPQRKSPSEAKFEVHRAAIFDTKSCITGIISQSDIVRYLVAHESSIGSIKDQTIESLGLGFKHVMSTTPETSAVEALKVMDDGGVTAIAVVNSKGEILGNFSAADMRTITTGHFGALALPVGEFLALEHGTEYAGFCVAAPDENVAKLNNATTFARDRASRTKPTRTPGADVGQDLVICKPSDTLIHVMQLQATHKVHRVFIVEGDLHPIGIITCTDVIKKLMDQ